MICQNSSMNIDSLDEHRVEFKYHLDPTISTEVRDWARQHMLADEHCDPSQGDSYDVHTLYLDTEAWDLYQRTDVIGKTKHRVRRYGNSDTLWLETKKKNKQSVVTKRRSALPTSQWLKQLQQPDQLQAWDGQWFMDSIRERELRPAVNVHYRRFARMLKDGPQAMRLTIDSRLEGSLPLSDGNIGERPTNEKRSLGSLEILELKFHGVMPDLFKALLQEFPLQAAGFSKFRSAVDAQALTPQSPVLSIDSAPIENAAQRTSASPIATPQTLGESA